MPYFSLSFSSKFQLNLICFVITGLSVRITVLLINEMKIRNQLIIWHFNTDARNKQKILKLFYRVWAPLARYWHYSHLTLSKKILLLWENLCGKAFHFTYTMYSRFHKYSNYTVLYTINRKSMIAVLVTEVRIYNSLSQLL